jgi:hypothetical protein
MFNIIQTVHHDDGKQPSYGWYRSFDDIYSALDFCHTMNCGNADKNQRNDSIPITYHIEYHS